MSDDISELRPKLAIALDETLAEDFATVAGRLGVDATLPHINSSRTQDYREVYMQKAMRVVELSHQIVGSSAL